MFKSKKAPGNPQATPKIGSISLPDDRGASPLSWLPRRPAFKAQPVSQSLFPQRCSTPTPERSRRESVSTQSTRTRTSSLSSTSSSSQAPFKSILKSGKDFVSAAYTPMIPQKSRPEPVADHSRPPLAYEGRMHSVPTVSRSARESFSKPAKLPYIQPSSGWESEPGAGSISSLKSSKLSSRRHSGSTTSDKDGYYLRVTETPLKDAAISLSWPLMDATVKRRTLRYPALIFDIADDPRHDLNLRIFRGGACTRMSRQEEDMPVSSHCTVTKMTITCKKLSHWPITLERREGLRCRDVFMGIYEQLHKQITSKEARKFDRSFLLLCEPAFRERCHRAPGLTEVNMKDGLRRVDLLQGRRMFKGLKPDGSDWELLLDFPSYR